MNSNDLKINVKAQGSIEPPGKDNLLKWSSDYIINWSWWIGRILFQLQWRNNKGVTGRFGGGWNWKFGIQAGGHTLLISLVVMEISIHIATKMKKEKNKS